MKSNVRGGDPNGNDIWRIIAAALLHRKITPQLGNAADRIVTPATLRASNDLTINLR
jgi:hypothetical protein